MGAAKPDFKLGKIEVVKISDLKINPENPRFIRDEKFKQLKERLKSHPEHLGQRPIIVDSDLMILGGNMRYRAAKDLGWIEIPISRAENWKPEDLKEFIITDNLGFGEWDYDLLYNEWDADYLEGIGMDLPHSADDREEMGNPENEQSEKPFATELDQESNYIVLKFTKDIDWIQAKTLFGIKTETAKRPNGKAWSSGVGRVIEGVEAIRKLQK